MSRDEKDWSPTIIDDVRAVKFTPSGAALVCECNGKRFVVPCSLIGEDSECYKPGTSGTLQLPLWLCVEKELV